MPSTPAALFRFSRFKAAETSSRVMSAFRKSKGWSHEGFGGSGVGLVLSVWIGFTVVISAGGCGADVELVLLAL